MPNPDWKYGEHRGEVFDGLLKGQTVESHNNYHYARIRTDEKSWFCCVYKFDTERRGWVLID